VVRVPLPALRSRLSDLPLLVERLLQQLGAPQPVAAELRQPAFLATLATGAWPGNVRELRNFIEGCVVFQRRFPWVTKRRARRRLVQSRQPSVLSLSGRR
jgi:DNA-binding NtrC family response regulator